MAKAGDGGERSNKRQRSEMINVRTHAVEKRQFEEMARRHDFVSLSAWALDRLQAEDGMCMRDRIVLCGMLTKVAAPLRKLIHEGNAASPAVLRGLLKTIDTDIVAMQKIILKGGLDVGEGDPEPGI